MLSETATHSPTKLGISDIKARMARLEVFEAWRVPVKLDYETILGPEKWASHMAHLDEILNHMAKAELDAANLRASILEHLQSGKKVVPLPA